MCTAFVSVCKRSLSILFSNFRSSFVSSSFHTNNIALFPPYHQLGEQK
jgi:hypothetical protein